MKSALLRFALWPGGLGCGCVGGRRDSRLRVSPVCGIARVHVARARAQPSILERGPRYVVGRETRISVCRRGRRSSAIFGGAVQHYIVALKSSLYGVTSSRAAYSSRCGGRCLGKLTFSYERVVGYRSRLPCPPPTCQTSPGQSPEERRAPGDWLHKPTTTDNVCKQQVYPTARVFQQRRQAGG